MIKGLTRGWVAVLCLAAAPVLAQSADMAPDALAKSVTDEVLA